MLGRLCKTLQVATSVVPARCSHSCRQIENSREKFESKSRLAVLVLSSDYGRKHFGGKHTTLFFLHGYMQHTCLERPSLKFLQQMFKTTFLKGYKRNFPIIAVLPH